MKGIRGNYYLYTVRSVWDEDKKKAVKKTALLGSTDWNGAYREKRPKRTFSSFTVYEYGKSQCVCGISARIYTG
ncbi:MAG: hypothetical protein QXU18_04515 [Thermoplasmatales archaeon]